jgi:hypothetical protein
MGGAYDDEYDQAPAKAAPTHARKRAKAVKPKSYQAPKLPVGTHYQAIAGTLGLRVDME